MAEGDFNIKAIISAETSKFESGLKKGQVSLNDFGSVIEKILGPKGKVVLAVAGVTAAFMKMGQAMNASMSEIAKGTGATGEKLYKFRENVHDALSVGVGRSAKEVGKMVADLNTRFKVTGDELVKLTSQFDDFANIAGMDTSSAINLTADVMAKWNIETEDTNKLLDQLTVASQESGASIETLLNDLKSGQAIFSQFGMSATDTIAFVGTLKENGIEASNALLGMRTALAKFAQEGLDASTAFAEVSERIKNATSETEALNIAVETFGARSGAEMVKVLRDGSQSAEEFKNKLLEAGGAVAETDRWSRTSKDALDDLKSAFLGTFGGLFEGVDSLMKGVFDSISEILRTLDPILRPIINIIRDILSTVGELLSEFFRNIRQLNEEYNVVFQTIANTTQSVYEIIHEILGNLLEVFKSAFGLIFSILGGKWELAWEYAKKIIIIAAKSILDTVSGLVNMFSEDVNIFIEKIINPIIDGINKIRELMGKPLVERLEPIGKLNLSKITGLEKELDKVNSKIQDLTGETEKKITGDLGKIEKNVFGTFDGIEKKSKKQDKENKKRLLSFGESVKELIQSIKDDAQDWSDVVSSSFNAVKDSANQMMSDIGKGLAEGSLSYEDFAATAVNALAQVLQGLAAQLSAIAAVKALSHDYAGAALAAGAAAAALVSSGVLAGVASQMKSTGESSEEASQEINAVGTAAQGTYLTLDQFIDRVNQIKESFSGASSGVVQYVLESKKALNQGYSSLNQYGQQVINLRNNLKQTKEEQERFHQELTKKYGYDKTGRFYGRFYGSDPLSVGEKNKLEELEKDITKFERQLQSMESVYAQYLNKINELENSMTQVYAQTNNSLRAQINDNKELLGLYDSLYDLANNFILNITNTEAAITRFNMLMNEQFLTIQQTVVEFYGSLSNIGMNIGETLLNSISEGATKKDFLKSIRDYIRTNLLRISIYTEDFQTKLANLGTKLAASIADNGYGLEQTKKDIDDLWNTASTKAKRVDDILSGVFGDISDSIENAEESLTSFEEAMNSFFDSINDLGGEIADGIIDGLENGLDQGNFLDSMKQWIRKLLIQTVVYTDAMKSEIEAVGKAISGGLTKGFTETSLHEIRRDLSYIFNEANKTMGSIDSVLNTVFSGYATGTQNAMAGIHLVGESGPELVRFRGGEQVLNAQNTQAALEGAGGTTNNFNVTFNNLRDTSAYAMMNQLKAYNREMAINGVI